MRNIMLLCALAAPLALGACAGALDPGKSAATEAKPGGPCRDDENFENGRCVPRVQRQP